MINEIEKLKVLEDKGFEFVETKSPYEVARMKGPGTVILYNTGKLNIQGKSHIVEEVRKILGVSAPKKKTPSQGSLLKTTAEIIIGSDETLKGDTFGGLVVVAFRANKLEREKLQKLGVGDSKTFEDGKILEKAKKLREEFPDNFIVEEIEPLEYNSLIKSQNSTSILNKMHRDAAKKLRVPGSIHVVDLYPGCTVGDIMETKAESNYLEVAAASIIAREVGLKQFWRLSEKVGINLPLGSTHVESALKQLKGRNLREYAKTNFRNVMPYL